MAKTVKFNEVEETGGHVLRKELEGKIAVVVTKVDEKLSTSMFFSITGILVVILMAILSYFTVQNFRLSDKVEDVSRRVVAVETKFDILKK